MNKAEACSLEFILWQEKETINKKIVVYQYIESVVEGDTEVLGRKGSEASGVGVEQLQI